VSPLNEVLSLQVRGLFSFSKKKTLTWLLSVVGETAGRLFACQSLLTMQPNERTRHESTVTKMLGLMELNHGKPHQRRPKEARVCPTPGELRVVQTPIHMRVRPADNCGKFFVLCFQPVTFPRALYTQVTQASVHETMVTADSGSARGRHWKTWALSPPCTVQTHSPHSGNRKGNPFRDDLTRAPEGLHLGGG
jgi:hypothetical protein